MNEKVTSRKDIIQALLDNGKHKDLQIEQLSKRVEELETSVKMAHLVYPHMITAIIDQLRKEKREKLSDLYDIMKKKALTVKAGVYP